MKKPVIIPSLFLFLFICTVSGQENYKVIKVDGTITIKAQGTALQTGTVFRENDDLLFSTADASAAVINSQKGRLIITSKNHNLASARSNYLPSMYTMTTRGGTLISKKDLQNQFSGKFVILEKLLIAVGKSNFPMNKDHFFFLRYSYKGEDINKKLDYSGDTLIIDKGKLYTVDGNPIPNPDNTGISLFYRNGAESVLINKFELIFPDPTKLKQETQVILDVLKTKSDKEKLGEINSYINEFYGKVYPSNLTAWAEKNLKLKVK